MGFCSSAPRIISGKSGRRNEANVRHSRTYRSSRSQFATMKLLSVNKKPRDEIVQRSAPGLPFVGGALGFDEDVLDAGSSERVVHRLHSVVNLRFGRACAEPEEVDLFV